MATTRRFTKDSDPTILIDTNEATKSHTAKLASELLESKRFKTVMKDSTACKELLGLDKYEAWGDYIILFPEDSPVHPGGALIGIERKTTIDAYGRIVDGSMNAQLAELIGKTGGKAILMHERSSYVPAAIVRSFYPSAGRKVTKNEQAGALSRVTMAVDTKFNKLDFAVVRWEIDQIEQAIRHISDLCENGWNYEIEGRGYKISRTGKRLIIKDQKV